MQADISLGVSIFKREDETLPEYFMSFSPMAPFFGVPWRFAPAFGVKTGASASDNAPVAAVKPRPKRRTPAAKMIEAVSDPVLAAAPEPVAEAAISAVDAVDAVAETAAAPVVAAADAITPSEASAGTDASDAPVEAAGAKPAMLYAEAPETVDDLKLIKGVGPKLEKELNGLGLHTFAQMATLTPENLVWIDENLSSFKGKSLRDDWVGQASALLEG